MRWSLPLLLLLFVGCPGIVPGSVAYRPSGEAEREFYAVARRDIFPDDVREGLEAHRATLLAWTGIIESSRWQEDAPAAVFVVEHHYRDWIEDHSIQREVAFLSPRGEGRFSCSATAGRAEPGDPLPPRGDMAIAYGYPEAVDPASGAVALRCVAFSTAPRTWYGTDIWDYGRAYLLKGDTSDFKVLRVPF